MEIWKRSSCQHLVLHSLLLPCSEPVPPKAGGGINDPARVWAPHPAFPLLFGETGFSRPRSEATARLGSSVWHPSPAPRFGPGWGKERTTLTSGLAEGLRIPESSLRGVGPPVKFKGRGRCGFLPIRLLRMLLLLAQKPVRQACAGADGTKNEGNKSQAAHKTSPWRSGGLQEEYRMRIH